MAAFLLPFLKSPLCPFPYLSLHSQASLLPSLVKQFCVLFFADGGSTPGIVVLGNQNFRAFTNLISFLLLLHSNNVLSCLRDV